MNRTAKRIVFVALLVVLVGGVLPWGLVRLGNIFFADNPAQARLVWTIAQFTSLYDRDIIYYDIGNSYYKERNYDAAADAYKSADAVASPKNICPIRYNWGLTLMDKGDHSTSRDTARSVYSEALRVISLNSCQTDPLYKANFDNLYLDLLARLKKLNEKPEDQQSESSNEDSEHAEEAAKDNKQEKSASKDYQNLQRFYNRDSGASTGNSTFVW